MCELMKRLVAASRERERERERERGERARERESERESCIKAVARIITLATVEWSGA